MEPLTSTGAYSVGNSLKRRLPGSIEMVPDYGAPIAWLNINQMQRSLRVRG